MGFQPRRNELQAYRFKTYTPVKLTGKFKFVWFKDVVAVQTWTRDFAYEPIIDVYTAEEFFLMQLKDLETDYDIKTVNPFTGIILYAIEYAGCSALAIGALVAWLA